MNPSTIMRDENSDAWYKGVEKAKDKARKLIGKVVAINQSTSLVVGKLDAADIDKLGPSHQSTCKITLSKTKRYDLKSNFKFRDEYTVFLFVNKPEAILSAEELEKTFPKVYEEVRINVKKGVWNGS